MSSAHTGSAAAPRFGVAMCTYNGAPYLQAQLDSILAQTVPVDEVVVGDDGSCDATLAMLDAFAVRASARGIRVEVVQHPRNLGYVANFSDALQRCRADVLFLCDQDDVWDPDRVEAFASRFDADPTLLMLHSDARLVDGEGAPLGATLLEVLRAHPAEIALERSGQAMDAILLRNFITGATCALRRSLLAEALPVAPRWSHDEWLAVIASLKGGLDLLPRSTIDYRQHGGNQIGASRRSILHQFRALNLRDRGGQQRTAERLRGLQALLQARGVTFAPDDLQGLAAVAWRMAWSRLHVYRRVDVDWRWIAHDAPRLVARIANACLAGGGWRGGVAACRGAWTGWRGGV
ncbi:glycosyltransferase family 2 protein [Stenotrophomonas sp.]|uniref:glycosyltransferase family 2 protein n=1 Tax=Stenotrophomonas sp. TaxID=69392 RepID=UPI0028A594B9|nr:glycosyltransferase family 2 protein [Stenotrophomonas sp.]